MLSFSLWPGANVQRHFVDQCIGGIPFVSEKYSSQYAIPEEDDYDFDYDPEVFEQYS